MEGCEFQTQDATNGLTLFSDEPHPKVWFTFHYRNPSRWKPESLQQQSGAQPTTGLGAPVRLQVTTKGLNHSLGSNDPRVTSSRTFTSTNLRGESKPMHKSNGKSTRSAQVLHSQIPPKATNAYGGRREEEQRRTQQMELQDQDLLGSPHLEEKWIGGIVDLDLFSLFPQRYARIMRGKLFQGQQWRREREGKTCSGG